VLERWIAVIAFLGMRNLAPLVYRRMASAYFGDLVEDRPTFDRLLDEAERNPAAEIDDIAATFAKVAQIVDREAEREDIAQDESRRKPAPPPSVQDILSDLSNAPFTRPPTIRAAMARIREMAPLLQADIEKAASAEKLTEKDSVALCRYIYILTAVRHRGIFHPLLQILQRSEPPFQFLIDGIFPDLTAILVNLFDWDAEALFALVADSAIDPDLRAKLLDAASFLTFHGRIAAERMAQFLRDFDVSGLTDQDHHPLLQRWICAIGLLGLRDLALQVAQRLNAGDCPDLQNFWITEGGLQRLLTTAEKLPYERDRFKGLEIFAFFNLTDALLSHPVPSLSTLPPGGAAVKPPWTPKAAPATNALRNVGRNDPCPCGSGRKAKKCCLANR